MRRSEEELLAFRRWLAALSLEDLLQAMQYDFPSDSGGESHEYELLQQLVATHSVPPIPVHPAGMGYRPWGTKMGPNDGRPDEARILKNRFTKPRLFQLYERDSGERRNTTKRKKYDILARRKVTDAGDVLGLGSTQQQRDADVVILKGTLIYQDGRCGFHPDLVNTQEDLLLILHVVSRGHFRLTCLPNSAKAECFWTPWLNPTERWFSLPMFLASRFEVALWSVFRGNLFVCPVTPVRDLLEKLSRGSVERAQQKAMLRTLKVVLAEDRKDFPMFLDGLMYDLLDFERSSQLLFECRNGLDYTPLLEVHTKRAKFRKVLRKELEEELVLQMQEEFLAFEFDEPTKSNGPAVSSAKRKKSKKKKKKRGTVSSKAKAEPEVAVEEGNESDQEGHSHVRFSAPPSMEHTRKTIIALSVIEDILESVFDKVGLSPASEPVAPEASKSDKVKHGRPTSNVAMKKKGKEIPIGSAHRDVHENEVPAFGEAHEREIPLHDLHHGTYPYLAAHPTEADLQVFGREPALHGLPWDFDEATLVKFPGREKSVFADFFLKDDSNTNESDPQKVASSTAVSVASEIEPDAVDDIIELHQDEEVDSVLVTPGASGGRMVKAISYDELAHMSSPELDVGRAESLCSSHLRSPSPTAPRTPPPQLSPILLSLDDIKDIKERNPDLRSKSYSVIAAGSLPSSPVQATNNTLATSWSREDLRINVDDNFAGKRSGSMSVEASSPQRFRSGEGGIAPPVKGNGKTNGRYRFGKESVVPVRGLSIPALDPGAPKKKQENCAHSETAIEAHDDAWNGHHHQEHAHVSNITTTRDESTTVSALSPREPEEVGALREERNTFRDMCLTLGAEVATLKNLLASQNVNHMYVAHGYVDPTAYDQEFMQPNFHGITRSTTTIGAMSDAGMHRENDSAFSEDGTDHHEATGKPRAVFVRRLSSGATGSDMSLDHNAVPHPAAMSSMPSFRPVSNDPLELVSACHSRLTTDIVNFLHANRLQVQKQDRRIQLAVQRLSRLTTAVWPRAQVKLYGSHVTGLSLPSSDLDFVIGLPAVHKNAPAITPGALEGRNAINESSQKLLARKMKGEPWLDPRSIKMIERTIVPVIKVSTKDTRAHALQLDISFDGPVHHGLEAIDMVNDILQDLPMVRPLVLVLKQFLIDRGLLVAYTGGLSSYCLFLMVTRYLQEQPSSWGDCGSLLMGFLDFYGNSFDPRTTGISVRRSQYFARRAMPQPVPYQPPPTHIVAASSAASGSGRPDFLRRHSFTEKANMPDHQNNWNHRPPRHSPAAATTRFAAPPTFATTLTGGQHHAGKPYTFDPLWVEDPLSGGNNVGRNAFRIFSVQRAFSDAHRALVASLEWDHAEDKDDYPLLKCLLQNQDVFYDLDDHHR